MQEKVVVAYSEVYQPWPRGTEKNHQNLHNVSRHQT